MANYFTLFTASKAHIDFMKDNEGTCFDYYDAEPVGTACELDGITPPDDWPEDGANSPDMEINHRNVDLYHCILNKTLEPVAGAGSLFQTWFYSEHDAIELDDESFALYPEHIPELLTLVQAITPESAKAAFALWGEKHNKGFDEEDLANADIFVDEFKAFEEYLQDAITQQQGLVWIVC